MSSRVAVFVQNFKVPKLIKKTAIVFGG